MSRQTSIPPAMRFLLTTHWIFLDSRPEIIGSLSIPHNSFQSLRPPFPFPISESLIYASPPRDTLSALPFPSTTFPSILDTRYPTGYSISHFRPNFRAFQRDVERALKFFALFEGPQKLIAPMPLVQELNASPTFFLVQWNYVIQWELGPTPITT
jgi:hypothetical protein